jgi:hypothetical protein
MIETEFKELESINNLLVAQVKDLKGKRNRNVRALGLIQKGVTDLIFPRVIRAVVTHFWVPTKYI